MQNGNTKEPQTEMKHPTILEMVYEFAQDLFDRGQISEQRFQEYCELCKTDNKVATTDEVLEAPKKTIEKYRPVLERLAKR
jgi:hypothetical protein